MAAWHARGLTEASVREIAAALEESPATVVGAKVVGGASATGVTVSLAYEGDDVPRCGNDILFWLKWHLTHGSVGVHPPRIIINGVPFPDLVRLELDFGNVGNPAVAPATQLAGELGGGLGG
jgi:hypothetical protein